MEPGAIGRRGRLARADRRIVVVAVEERTVGRDMVEDAVEDHAHPAPRGLPHERLEVVEIAEVRVDPVVVLRVVPVVRGAVEDRVEVDRGDAQRGEVVELLRHALQVAAEVVTAARRLARARRLGEARRTDRARGVVAAVALGQVAPAQLDDLVPLGPARSGRVAAGVRVARIGAE